MFVIICVDLFVIIYNMHYQDLIIVVTSLESRTVTSLDQPVSKPSFRERKIDLYNDMVIDRLYRDPLEVYNSANRH